MTVGLRGATSDDMPAAGEAWPRTPLGAGFAPPNALVGVGGGIAGTAPRLGPAGLARPIGRAAMSVALATERGSAVVHRLIVAREEGVTDADAPAGPVTPLGPGVSRAAAGLTPRAAGRVGSACCVVAAATQVALAALAGQLRGSGARPSTLRLTRGDAVAANGERPDIARRNTWLAPIPLEKPLARATLAPAAAYAPAGDAGGRSVPAS